MTYLMNVNVQQNEAVKEVPIELQLLDASGKAVAGEQQQSTLAPGSAAQYALYWEWPYERGNGAEDTAFGQASLSEDISYTVTITTLATMDAAGDGGLSDADTLDSSQGAFGWLVKTADAAMPLVAALIVLVAVVAGIAFIALHRSRSGEVPEAPHRKGRR